MSNSVIGIVLIVALAGFGLGYVVGTGSSEVAAPESGLDALGGDGVDPIETPVDHLEGPGLESAPRSSASLRAVVAGFPAPRRPMGDGVIKGMIVTDTGEPLAGVEVTAVPKQASALPTMSKDPAEALLQRLEAQIAGVKWREVAATKVVSGADGSFALEGLSDTEHQLITRLEGWRIQATDRRAVRAAQPGATLEFIAKAVSKLELEVYLPDGTQPESASVRLQSGSHNRSSGWAPSRPSSEVPAGSYQLTVAAGRNQEFKSEPITVEVARGQTTRLRVELSGKPVLVIKLRFEGGEETGGEVYYMAASSSELPTGAVLRSRGKSSSLRGSRIGRGREAGTTVQDLQPGAYAVGYTRGRNRKFVVIDLVELKAGLLEYELVVPSMDPADYVVLRVRNPQGKPVPDARISTGYFTPNSSSGGSSPVVDKGEGVYWVMHHAHGWGKADDETWYISVQGGTLGAKRVDYDARTTRSIDIDFQPPARLELFVKGVAGSPYETGVHVTLGHERSQVARVTCDREGKAVFTGLQPGDLELTLQVGSGHFGTAVHTESITLKAGENRATLALPDLYSVTVRNAAGNVWVQAADPMSGSHFHRHVTASEGEAVVDALPAGEYTARSGSGSATFRVPGTSVVELREEDGK